MSDIAGISLGERRIVRTKADLLRLEGLLTASRSQRTEVVRGFGPNGVRCDAHRGELRADGS